MSDCTKLMVWSSKSWIGVQKSKNAPKNLNMHNLVLLYFDGQMDVTPIIIVCPEDINGDGTVDVTDILIVIGNWGGSGEGDVDGNGVVDVSDLLALVGAWGPC